MSKRWRQEAAKKALREAQWAYQHGLGPNPISDPKGIFPSPKPVFRRLEITTDEGLKASALWKSQGNVSSCVSADEPLRWMVGLSPAAAKIALLRMEAHWAWENVKHFVPIEKLGQPESVGSVAVRS